MRLGYQLAQVGEAWELRREAWPEATLHLGPVDDSKYTDWSALERRLRVVKGAIDFKGARLAVYGLRCKDEALGRRTVEELGGGAWRLPDEATATAVLYLLWRVENAPLVAAQVGALSQIFYATTLDRDAHTRRAMAVAWPEWVSFGPNGELQGLNDYGQTKLRLETGEWKPRPIRAWGNL